MSSHVNRQSQANNQNSKLGTNSRQKATDMEATHADGKKQVQEGVDQTQILPDQIHYIPLLDPETEYEEEYEEPLEMSHHGLA
ncbi:hypothetical protein N7495_001447 [Penicillium taxi]|uniref:uncharacterized protein n=1 Tax=Penicillium taxi TaxID=168475 RepID=UPI0025456749|nr:uncharacterized protein N7495_001447 [Penicillium taxi]KAJ5908765.1 hypothetical protein N7495_001447 [Penicillium taxi]